MAETITVQNVESENEAYDEDYEQLSKECKELLLSLPKRKEWVTPNVYLYRDIWYAPAAIQAICSFQRHFQAKDSEIVIATLPKSGITWLEALTFAIVNRKHFFPWQSNHPLLSSDAHELVPFLEFHHYANNQIPGLSMIPEPRRASKDTPDRVLFLKYEDLQADINYYLKRIAEFLECPLNLEEESNGTIRNIIELCSFEKMKELEVNKTDLLKFGYTSKVDCP
ncbi:cytosolic sulfotransferase 15-like [Neltuma alba]|uniref:cytosolic sulfotransferase 15-like n=1 Tax=Neltuma alba TaxID=207710 RepID=UPI0010A45D1B|nr:cytosolic sulfotransferase 15-like [Prosopis alba]